MQTTTSLRCDCGQTQLELQGAPIITAECHCNSCREAASRMRSLPTSRPVEEPNGGTRMVLYRKDRIRFAAGAEQLEALRVQPTSSTRRVIAACCKTPLFLEFQNGHWLSLYSALWPVGTAPRPELRTMTSDLPPSTAAALPRDIPNSKTQSVGFFLKLLAAWIAMGFRVPKIPVARELS